MTVAIGIFAAVLTTACWGPQLFRTLRRGTAEDFAWVYLIMLTTGVFGWALYGVLRHDPVIWVANSIVTASALVVVVVKLRSRHLVIEDVEFVVPGEADPLSALESLVTVGPKLAADLRAVGIADFDALRAVGVTEANRRLVAAGLVDDPRTGRGSAESFSGSRWSARRNRGAPGPSGRPRDPRGGPST